MGVNSGEANWAGCLTSTASAVPRHSRVRHPAGRGTGGQASWGISIPAPHGRRGKPTMQPLPHPLMPHTHTHTHAGHLKSVHRWRQSAPPVALQDEAMWWEREIGGTVPREASRPPPVMLHPSSAAPSGCQRAASTTKLPATGLFIAALFDIQENKKENYPLLLQNMYGFFCKKYF